MFSQHLIAEAKIYTSLAGSMIISLLMNITMNQLGGASVIAIFTTRRSHGYVNTTTWLGISQFFLFFGAKFQYFDNGE